MIDDEKSGSGQILKGMREQHAPEWAINTVRDSLLKSATRAELYDLIYEQMMVNIALGNALSTMMIEDRGKAVEKLGLAIDAIQQQTSTYGMMAARLVLPPDNIPAAETKDD